VSAIHEQYQHSSRTLSPRKQPAALADMYLQVIGEPKPMYSPNPRLYECVHRPEVDLHNRVEHPSPRKYQA